MTVAQERRNIAADYLDAAYSPVTHRYYYFAAEVSCWYRVTQLDLELLGSYLMDETDDAYSHWCNCSGFRVSRRAVQRAGVTE